MRGQQFVGPGGDRIPNKGEMVPTFLIETGALAQVKLQDGEVRKPLLAVSDVNGKGNPCWFDGNKSYVLRKGSPLLQEIRDLIAKVQAKIPMHLKNGTYIMKTWKRPARPFTGQGW